jgi:hypothetical protein
MAWSRGAVLLTAALLVHSVAQRADAAPGPAKTLTRFHDPVVVSTAELSSLPDHSTASFRLYRVEKGQFFPIPLQFDARDDHGDILVDGAAEFRFDDNDELVFMAKDTGDQALAAGWPADCDAVVEIAVIDPLHGERGWAYLVHFPGTPPPPAAEHYVSFDQGANQARSSFYQVDYARARNFYTGLRVTHAAGGNDTNLIRQTRMRGSPTLSLLFNDFTFEFTEQSSIVAIEGVRVGPVRAVRRVRLSVDLGRLFPDLPTGTVYTYHYFSSYVTPTRIGFPWIVLKTLHAFQFENVIDFDPRVMPMTYWDGANRDGLALAGHDGARVETDVDHDWWVHSGAAGTMLHAFVIPEPWRQWGITRGTVLRNGRGAADGNGRRPEEPVSEAGYSLLHMTNLREARQYDLLQAAFVLPKPYRPGDETEPMAMLRAPLRTEVRRVR